MARRITTRLVWTMWALVTVLALANFWIDLLGDGGRQNPFRIADDAVFSLAIPVATAAVAALIVTRQPRNTIGWLLMVQVGVFLVSFAPDEYLERIAVSSPAPSLPLLLMVWFSGWSWVLLIFPLLHMLLLFPDGHPPTPRWRWVSVAAIAWPTLFVLILTFSQPLDANTTPSLTLDNPIGVLGETVQVLVDLWVPGLLVLVVLSMAALYARYRRANDTEREQIKWLLYACAVFVVVYVGGAASGVAGSTGVAGSIWAVLFGLSLVALPAAIGIAILRYRLYDIDIIINRTLVYGTLTATLALAYFSSVVLLQQLFRFLTGQGTNQLAIVASTLLIAALFQPLRRRIQAAIDRRFYRRKYDAARILAAFSASLRDEVELDTLSSNLVAVVAETLQPVQVSLWLRDRGPNVRAPRVDEHQSSALS